MNQELIINILNQLKEVGICDKTINKLINSLDIENHIDKYEKYNTFPKINIHTPSTNTTYNLPIHPQDINFLKQINKRQYMELVERKESQKVAIKLLKLEDEALLIKDSLQEYLKSIGHGGNTISFTEVEKGYELIVYDLFVNNSKERVDFIINFKNFIDKKLHKYINLDDSFNETEYDYWLSINSLFDENNNIWPDFKLVNKFNDNGKFYNVYINNINNGNIINNIGNTGNINTNISIEKISSKEEFINHILENKPKWYKPNEFITIDTLYDKYLMFDKTAKKGYFATQFKNVLWKSKKVMSRKTYYKLIDLW